MKVLDAVRAYRDKVMSAQLRLPSGILARLTGNRMNKANELLYNLTLKSMPIKDGDHILELGFGNGNHFPELMTRAKELVLTGIDHSTEMVMEARRRNKNLVDDGRLTLIQGSSEVMPFDNESFEAIFCVNVIYFWKDPAVHLREIHRVLKPGGSFVTGFRPKENLSQFPFTKYGFTLYSEADWQRELEVNGFDVVGLYGENLEGKVNRATLPFESRCIVSVKN